MVRHDRHQASPSTVLRIMVDEDLHCALTTRSSVGNSLSNTKLPSPRNRMARIRCGSSTSASRRPPAPGHGGSQGLRTITQSTSSAGTGLRPRTSTTRSSVSSSPSRRSKRWSTVSVWSITYPIPRAVKSSRSRWLPTTEGRSARFASSTSSRPIPSSGMSALASGHRASTASESEPSRV